MSTTTETEILDGNLLDATILHRVDAPAPKETPRPNPRGKKMQSIVSFTSDSLSEAGTLTADLGKSYGGEIDVRIAIGPLGFEKEDALRIATEAVRRATGHGQQNVLTLLRTLAASKDPLKWVEVEAMRKDAPVVTDPLFEASMLGQHIIAVDHRVMERVDEYRAKHPLLHMRYETMLIEQNGRYGLRLTELAREAIASGLLDGCSAVPRSNLKNTMAAK